MLREMRNAYEILVRKSQGRIPLVRPGCGHEDNIKKEIKKPDGTVSTQDRGQWCDGEYPGEVSDYKLLKNDSVRSLSLDLTQTRGGWTGSQVSPPSKGQSIAEHHQRRVEAAILIV